VYHCSYRYKFSRHVAISIKTFQDRVEIALSHKHTSTSHHVSSGNMSVKQMSAVRSAPQVVGSQMHSNLKNFSPGKQIPFDTQKNILLRCLLGPRGDK
jgi:hypothetical protein